MEVSVFVEQRTTRGFAIWQADKEQMKSQMKLLYKISDLECHDQVLHRLDNLSNYFYQYIGVIYKGKKYIYINASDPKHADENWRTVPEVVGDGGLAYWGVYFDLKDNLFRYLAFNHTIGAKAGILCVIIEAVN